MNFSKNSPEGIPLWFLMWQGIKHVTRRPPACVHCGKKWFDHGAANRCLNADGTFKLGMEYYPNLSRWQPKEIPVHEIVPTMRRGVSIVITKRTDIIYKELAICPGRGRSAICGKCGCWKEHHTGDTSTWDKKTNEAWSFITKNSNKHLFCSAKLYEPLRLKVKSAQMESEWFASKGVFDAEHDKDARAQYIWELQEEAKREGFSGDWNALQAPWSKGHSGISASRQCRSSGFRI